MKNKKKMSYKYFILIDLQLNKLWRVYFCGSEIDLLRQIKAVENFKNVKMGWC
jgi:hypothetical protein